MRKIAIGVILLTLFACFPAFSAEFYWRDTKTGLDGISGLASGDRGMVITSSGEVRHYYYTSSWQNTTPMTAQMVLVEPDSVYVVTTTIPMLAVESTWAPHGITITKVGWKTSASATQTLTFKEYLSPTDGSPSTIEAVAGSAVTEADSTSIDDSSVAAGSIVMVTIANTDVNWEQIFIEYYITPGS